VKTSVKKGKKCLNNKKSVIKNETKDEENLWRIKKAFLCLLIFCNFALFYSFLFFSNFLLKFQQNKLLRFYT